MPIKTEKMTWRLYAWDTAKYIINDEIITFKKTKKINLFKGLIEVNL